MNDWRQEPFMLFRFAICVSGRQLDRGWKDRLKERWQCLPCFRQELKRESAACTQCECNASGRTRAIRRRLLAAYAWLVPWPFRTIAAYISGSPATTDTALKPPASDGAPEAQRNRSL